MALGYFPRKMTEIKMIILQLTLIDSASQSSSVIERTFDI